MQQPYVALSTCESELVASTEGMSLGQALEPLIAELTGFDLRVGLFSDNVACAAILTFPGGSWRTRHLRLRSHAIRERVDEGSLEVMHVPGPYMLGDCLTKTLPLNRLFGLLQYMGCEVLPSGAGRTDDPATLKFLSIPAGPLLCKLSLLVAIQPVAAQGRDPEWFSVWVWLVGFLAGLIGLTCWLWSWYGPVRASWRLHRLQQLARQVALEEPALLVSSPLCTNWSAVLPDPSLPSGLGPDVPAPVSYQQVLPNPSLPSGLGPDVPAPVSYQQVLPNPSLPSGLGPDVPAPVSYQQVLPNPSFPSGLDPETPLPIDAQQAPLCPSLLGSSQPEQSAHEQVLPGGQLSCNLNEDEQPDASYGALALTNSLISCMSLLRILLKWV